MASGRDKALIELLDTLPDFFYRSCTPPLDAEASCKTSLERRAVTRIGMTHAHVLILPADADKISSNWSGTELEVALTGLRQRIPIVAVCGPGQERDDTLVTRAADGVARWDAKDIGCAILQAVESEAVQRRKRIAQLDAVTDMVLSRDDAKQAARPSTAPSDGGRELPVEAIKKAFNEFKTASRR
ncbi:MAG: hypothetical protein R3D67_02895 [Hyphomicrobiaceae bacterium]